MLDLTAYHEAGHVFIALYVGARVDSVTIDPDWDDGPERYGDTQIAWPLNQFSERELYEKAVLVALAGPVAEMIHSGDPFHPAFVGEWAGDWSGAQSAAASLFPDPKKRMAYLEQTTLQLYQLLGQDTHWDALAGIADHLLAHETLEGEMVDEIAGRWFA